MFWRSHAGVQQAQGRDDVEQFGSGRGQAQQRLAQQEGRQAGRAYGSAHHVAITDDAPASAQLSPEDPRALVHENEVAEIFARRMAGEGVTYELPPHEGKIDFKAACNGLFCVDVERMTRFNLVPEVMVASRQDGTLVKQGGPLCGTRAIPLHITRERLGQALEALEGGPLFRVLPLRKARVGILVTGTEVFQGIIEDKFIPVITAKVSMLDCTVVRTDIVPDDKAMMQASVAAMREAGADLLITTGGLSVDPDDVTRQALVEAGLTDVLHGVPILPGTMLPVISAVYWRFDFFHADLSCRILTTPELIDLTPERLEKNRERLAEVEPVLPETRRSFELLAALDFDSLDEFEFRDAMDLGRTALHRLFLCRMTAFVLRLEAWRDGSADAKELERESAALTELLELEARLLAAHEDYSLNVSLDLLKRRDGYNPAFEETLKGNAENDYCRTQIYELVRTCYQPELAVYLDFVRRKIDGGDRAPWRTPDEFNIRAGMIRDAFYSTPLEHFRPNAAAAKRELADRFARLAGLCC